jgi:hypothetical protein
MPQSSSSNHLIFSIKRNMSNLPTNVLDELQISFLDLSIPTTIMLRPTSKDKNMCESKGPI